MKVVIKAKRYIPNLEYWWVGDGALMRDVKDFISAHNADGYIRLLGNRSDVASLYQAMDIFFFHHFLRDYLLVD